MEKLYKISRNSSKLILINNILISQFLHTISRTKGQQLALSNGSKVCDPLKTAILAKRPKSCLITQFSTLEA